MLSDQLSKRNPGSEVVMTQREREPERKQQRNRERMQDPERQPGQERHGVGREGEERHGKGREREESRPGESPLRTEEQSTPEPVRPA